MDHLLIGSSLPAIMLPALHHVEGWNEVVARDRPDKPLTAQVGEWIRLTVDLEHWAAFRNSFDDLVGLLTEVAAGTGAARTDAARTDDAGTDVATRRGTPPASILLLGGDVHCSYLEVDSRRRRWRDVADASAPAGHVAVPGPVAEVDPCREQAVRAQARAFATRRLARCRVREPVVRWQLTDGFMVR